MKAYLASLLAACAFAQEEETAETTTHYLIEEDADLFTWTDFDVSTEEAYESTGETLTLDATVDGDTVTFCFTPGLGSTDFSAADHDTAIFGVAWTNGEDYVEGETDVDEVVVTGTYDSQNAAWSWDVYDTIADAQTGNNENVSTVWTEVAENDDDFDCVLVCVGSICVERALTAAEGESDLPFASGTDFIGYYGFQTFTGVVYSGAMSLGLALAATAGAALTLV